MIKAGGIGFSSSSEILFRPPLSLIWLEDLDPDRMVQEEDDVLWWLRWINAEDPLPCASQGIPRGPLASDLSFFPL